MRSKISSYFVDGVRIIRAHVWTEKGYSTRTFMTAGEAEVWIRSKAA